MRVLTIDDWHDGPLGGLACENSDIFWYFIISEDIYSFVKLSTAEVIAYEVDGLPTEDIVERAQTEWSNRDVEPKTLTYDDMGFEHAINRASV